MLSLVIELRRLARNRIDHIPQRSADPQRSAYIKVNAAALYNPVGEASTRREATADAIAAR